MASSEALLRETEFSRNLRNVNVVSQNMFTMLI